MAWSTAEDINKEVLETVNNGVRYAHFSCSKELQRACINKLLSLHDRLKNLRYISIDQSNEPNANAAFRAQMLVSGMINFLEMWVLLKEDRPNEAWNKLAGSQKDFK